MTEITIDSLLDDCLLDIFEYLPFIDKINARRVCRRWASLCHRSFIKLHMLSGDGREWKFVQENNKVVHKVDSVYEMEFVLSSCGVFVKKLKVDGINTSREPVEFQAIMQVIAISCGNLRSISIMNIRDDIVPRIIPIIIYENKRLRSLKMKTIDMGVKLEEYLPWLPKDLEILHLHCLQVSEPSSIILVLETLQELKSLAFNHVPDIAARLLSTQRQLNHLCIKYSFTISDSFDYLTRLKNLVYLNIEDSYHIEDENLINISHYCKRIETLVISFCNRLTDIGISGLVEMRKLKSLRMKQLNKVTDASISILPNTLEILCFCGSRNIKDDGVIQLLRRARNLVTLHMNDCPEITNNTVIAAIENVTARMNDRPLKIAAKNSKIELEMLNYEQVIQITEVFHLLEIHLG